MMTHDNDKPYLFCMVPFFGKEEMKKHVLTSMFSVLWISILSLCLFRLPIFSSILKFMCLKFWGLQNTVCAGFTVKFTRASWSRFWLHVGFLFLTSVRYSWNHILSLPVCCIYFLSSCCSLRRFAQPYHHVGLSENRHAAMLAKLHGLAPFPHENDHKKV